MLPGQIVVIFQTSCDFINNLKGFMFFSKNNLAKGYHQVPMCEADIVTPFGLL